MQTTKCLSQTTFSRNKNVIFSPSQVTLRSVHNEDSVFSFQNTSDERESIKITFDLKSNVNENLYLYFGSNDLPLIQLGNNGFSIVGTEKFVGYNRDLPVTITVKKMGQYLVFCVGKEARASLLEGQNDTNFKCINVVLKASLNVDLEATILTDYPIEGSPSHDWDVFTLKTTNQLKKLLQHSQTEEIFNLVTNYDHVDINEILNPLISFFETAKVNQKYLPDWFTNLIISRLNAVNAQALAKLAGEITKRPLLKVSGLEIEFYKHPNRVLSIKRLYNKAYGEKFSVLKDISFDLHEGDILGVLGVNGAGKSTLLRTIAGTITPKAGNIEAFGEKMLISPGLGIRNELSGRENILLACIFMGFSMSQAHEMCEDIINFSDLRESIDRPFKYYSDGMKSRLIFAIATSIAPEVLMLDELLNAGDVAFQEKAAKRMDEFIRGAKAVIVVTHSTPFILEKCNKALLISNGNQVSYGDPNRVVSRYYNYLNLSNDPKSDKKQSVGTETNSASSFLPSL